MKSRHSSAALLSGLFAALLFAAVLPSQGALARPGATATDTVKSAWEAPPKTWTANLGAQTRWLLEAPDATRQDRAMLLILHYNRQNMGADANFRPAVPKLLDIYESDVPEGRRLLALAALESIGEPFVMRQLAERTDAEASETVHRQTLRVLAAHRD